MKLGWVVTIVIGAVAGLFLMTGAALADCLPIPNWPHC